VHLSIEAESITDIFSFWCGKLGLLTEEEFLSDPGIGFISSSKSNFINLVDIFGWVKLQEIQTLV